MRTKRMQRIWERMSALYGSRWGIEYGPVLRSDGTLAPVAGHWADALDGLENDRIAAGIRACIDRDNPHPPSMPEFLRMCGYRPKSRNPAHADFEPGPTFLQLPSPAYSDSPRARCERLAQELQAQAEREFYPSIKNYPPDARKKAVARYWLTKIAAIPGLGYTVSEALKSANPELRDAA